MLLNVIVPVPLVVVPNCKEAHTALETSTVTVIPGLMVTVEPEAGTAAPPQVAGELQLPLTLATDCANDWPANMMNMTKKKINLQVAFALVVLRKS